jgi:hypothetical protein
MEGSLTRLTEADLLFLADTLAQGGDRGRMTRVLREDEEILRAMLADARLFKKVTSEPEAPVQVSPRLLFAVLLYAARRDLASMGYTFEGGHTIVFDGPRIASLLDDTRILDYLVELLVSFVRVHGTTVTVRVRKGVWSRFRFNDLDLAGLIRYAATLDEADRFPWYRRIADLCLFLTGVFPDYIERRAGAGGRGQARETTAANGRNFYRAAATHPEAARAGTAEVLARLAETFDLAAKPLEHVSSRYLGPLRENLFSP